MEVRMASVLGIVELLKVAREVDDTCSVQKLQVLCFIAACGEVGTDHATIQNRVDVGKSHCSRIVADWSELTADKRPGPAFVNVRIDPMNSRHRIITLTEKGREFVNKLMEVKL